MRHELCILVYGPHHGDLVVFAPGEQTLMIALPDPLELPEVAGGGSAGPGCHSVCGHYRKTESRLFVARVWEDLRIAAWSEW